MPGIRELPANNRSRDKVLRTRALNLLAILVSLVLVCAACAPSLFANPADLSGTWRKGQGSIIGSADWVEGTFNLVPKIYKQADSDSGADWWLATVTLQTRFTGNSGGVSPGDTGNPWFFVSISQSPAQPSSVPNPASFWRGNELCTTQQFSVGLSFGAQASYTQTQQSCSGDSITLQNNSTTTSTWRIQMNQDSLPTLVQAFAVPFRSFEMSREFKTFPCNPGETRAITTIVYKVEYPQFVPDTDVHHYKSNAIGISCENGTLVTQNLYWV